MPAQQAKPLSPTEKRIAALLAHGKTPAAIAAETGIKLLTVRVHLSNIRAKASAKKLPPGRLASHLTHSAPPEKRQLKLTPAQRSVLLMLAEGKPYPEICKALGLAYTTALNHACQGCKRLGVTGTGLVRQIQLRAALGLDGKPPGQPITMQDPFF